MGVPAEFQGRNDIVVEGKKISGNAQAWYKNKMLHHGTLLFDADLNFVAKVLNVKPDKIESKGIKSNRARVTNIKPYLKDKINMYDLKLSLLESLLDTSDVQNNVYPLSESQLNIIKKIQSEKYRKWEWNYGESPKSTIHKERRYNGGKLSIYFDLEGGFLRNLSIYGDFLDQGDISRVLSKITNTRYNKKSLLAALANLYVSHIIYGISSEELVDCIVD
jgi:lipoate-protein ligase A